MAGILARVRILRKVVFGFLAERFHAGDWDGGACRRAACYVHISVGARGHDLLHNASLSVEGDYVRSLLILVHLEVTCIFFFCGTPKCKLAVKCKVHYVLTHHPCGRCDNL